MSPGAASSNGTSFSGCRMRRVVGGDRVDRAVVERLQQLERVLSGGERRIHAARARRTPGTPRRRSGPAPPTRSARSPADPRRRRAPDGAASRRTSPGPPRRGPSPPGPPPPRPGREVGEMDPRPGGLRRSPGRAPRSPPRRAGPSPAARAPRPSRRPASRPRLASAASSACSISGRPGRRRR